MRAVSREVCLIVGAGGKDGGGKQGILDLELVFPAG
jgi:phosphoheptose isomerase